MASLEDLQTPDERTLRFAPLGLLTRHKLRPQAAVEIQQAAVDVVLAARVPGPIRSSFARVQGLHVRGVLSYELFTEAHDRTRLLLDQALRARFIEYYGGVFPFVAKDGTSRPLTTTHFETVRAALNGGSHRKAQWLVVGERTEPMHFRGSLEQLFRWARAVGLLAGQRNRIIERELVEARHRVAHPTHDRVVMPVTSAQAIRDLGEIINQLWGARTPNGRLYPEPTRREPIAIGRDAAGTSLTCLTPEDLAAPPDPEISEYILVRASLAERDLWLFDARRETLPLPSDYLWGPGSCEQARAYLEAMRPQPDEVDHLDRLFLLRDTDDDVDVPLRPEAYAALSAEDQVDVWHLVLADHPGDARHHARRVVHGEADCATSGPCDLCPAQTLLTGTWRAVLAAYEDLGGVITRRPLPDVRVDRSMPT